MIPCKECLVKAICRIKIRDRGSVVLFCPLLDEWLVKKAEDSIGNFNHRKVNETWKEVDKEMGYGMRRKHKR